MFPSHDRAGSRTADSEDFKRIYEDVFDETSSPLDLSAAVNRAFTGERDLAADTIIKTEGGELEPYLFQLQTAKTLDPYASLNQGLQNVLRNRLVNDYKIQAVENFVQEFGDILQGSLEELRRNPVQALMNPQFVQGADPSKLAAANAYRTATMNLLGAPTPIGKTINWMKGKLVDSVYSKAGSEKAEVVADWQLGQVRDPFTFLRNAAFHMKLGMFNPVQFFLQAQTHAHIVALTGVKRGSKATMGTILMRYGMLNDSPEIIASLADKAKAFGWSKEEFTEAFREMRRTGIENIGGEVAWRDDIVEPKLFKSSIGSFFDKGTFFFSEGERSSRMTGWNAAYLEWREANPGKTTTSYDRNRILRRQNDLTLNMTRASNSNLQRGVFSSVTQFTTYHNRLLEQFVSPGRLVGPDGKSRKLRAVATYSFLYGVPVGVGAPVGS